MFQLARTAGDVALDRSELTVAAQTDRTLSPTAKGRPMEAANRWGFVPPMSMGGR